MNGHCVQTDLHKFFKVKKHNKESVKSSKTLCQDIPVLKCKPEKSNYIKKCNALTEVEHSEREENSVNDLNIEDSTLKEKCFTNSSELALTPKRKVLEDGEEPFRKRKRQELEDMPSEPLSETPPSDGFRDRSLNFEKAKFPSAKKRLNLEETKPPKLEQKKLDPVAVKKELGKCGRLDELRARLLKVNQCGQKLQAFRNQTLQKEKYQVPFSPTKSGSTIRRDIRSASSPYKLTSPRKDHRTPLSPCKVDGLRLKNFSSLDIEVPVSPSKSPAKPRTPVKPCHERFQHLIASPSNQLQLPYRFQLVKEMFHAVDTIVSLLHNRQEHITFSKLKPAVQEMLRKTFVETHLGQLKTVFPLAYFFSQEKTKSKKASSYNCVSYELTVNPNFNYKMDSGERKAVHNLKQDFDNLDFSSSSKYRKMDSVVLVERRNIFHQALLETLKKHHSTFLQSLDPPIKLDGPLRKWHPEFPIEEVESPTPSPLPQPPKEDDLGTAKDVLDKARDIFSVNQRMKDAVESAVSAAGSAPKATRALPQDNGEIAAALKGVSLSLLQKIRAREASKAVREMTRSVGASQELEMLSRLPEMVRVLRSMFVTEKKAALPWETVISKAVASHSGSLSSGEAEKHLNLLMKEIPGWCTSHKVRSGLYLKIDKTKQLQQITDQLNTIIKEKT